MRPYPILLAAIALAGCGGDATTLDPVAEAATKTSGVGSVRFQLRMSVPDPDTGELLRLSGPGVIARHGNLISMRMHVAASGDTDAFTMDAVMAKDAMYMRSPAFAIAMPRGKEWLKLRDTDPFGNIGQNDPAQMLDYLRAAGDVEEVGTARVQGLETTKYRATIVLDKVAQRVPEDRRHRVEAAIDQLHRLGVDSLPMTVWVDGKGLVRRATMDWAITNPDDKTDKFRLTMTVDLFDFGTKARVTVPAAAKTMSYADFLKRNGGG